MNASALVEAQYLLPSVIVSALVRPSKWSEQLPDHVRQLPGRQFLLLPGIRAPFFSSPNTTHLGEIPISLGQLFQLYENTNTSLL